LPRWWCQIPPQKLLFSQTASNLNYKVYSVMMIEYKEKPAYLLGYVYAANIKKWWQHCHCQ
jgi:hypothetical protein